MLNIIIFEIKLIFFPKYNSIKIFKKKIPKIYFHFSGKKKSKYTLYLKHTSVNTGAIVPVCMHFLNMHVIILECDNIVMLLNSYIN